MLAVSHALDPLFESAPPRLYTRGALIADIWSDVILGLWERWAAFTDVNEDVRATTVLWELAGAEKIGEVGIRETAYSARMPHYWVVVHGR